MVRQLLAKGVEEDRKEFAAKIFRERKVSLREAAEIAGVSTTEMIEILKERGIKLDYSLESLRRDFEEDGVNFVSKPDFPLQLGISNYQKGSKIKAHFHIEKEIKIDKILEVVHIESGRTVVDLYDLNGKKIKSVELSADDTIFFVDGGHGFEMLEDTKIIEVKQGPYFGKDKDNRMIE